MKLLSFQLAVSSYGAAAKSRLYSADCGPTERPAPYPFQGGIGVYATVAEQLGEMGKMFSFPHGGEPNSEEQAERALTLLREAKASESSGIALLHYKDKAAGERQPS